MRVLSSALCLLACSSPPPPTIPPREEIGPPLPAANDCFPPYPNDFGQAWFVLADLDLGVSCRVFLEQDECVVAIFDDCTDPNPSGRQWVGRIDTEPNGDRIEFEILQGTGTAVGRPPKCCSGDVTSHDWAGLDCRLSSCDNLTDRIHVGALLEREIVPDPFLVSDSRETIVDMRDFRDFALLPGKGEIWAISQRSIIAHPIGGTTDEFATATDARFLVVAPDEGTAWVADGSRLLRIDTITRSIAETVDLTTPIELLAYADRGILVGVLAQDQMMLSLRRAGNISTVDAQAMVPVLADIIEIDGGSNARAFLAATERGDLEVLTSSLTSASQIAIEKPARSLHPVVPGVIGFLAECSERSIEEHCFFEIDLSLNTIRRTGIPDIGRIIDAVYDPPGDRMIFSGMHGLAVLDRSTWRPLVQRSVAVEGLGRIALSPTDVYVLAPAGGFVEHFFIR